LLDEDRRRSQESAQVDEARTERPDFSGGNEAGRGMRR
jgi:hypothetical protein